MPSLEERYANARACLQQRVAAGIAVARLDPGREASLAGKLFDVARKRRSASAYRDVADHLLTSYPPEIAYAVAIEINEQFERRVGYPPIGQIIVALEERGDERAAQVIACSLRNFPRVETARLAFGVIKTDGMRSLLRAELSAEDPDLAEYISAGSTAAPRRDIPIAQLDPSQRTEGDHGQHQLSDGIERMPRRLTLAEQRADRLFLHLQAVSYLALLVLPGLGFALRRFIGLAVGLVAGWCVRRWMRHSLGLRGRNPDEGFFIRMRERATGSRRGVLELLIESVRRRPFTREQCVDITRAWDETKVALADAESPEARRALIEQLDSRIKRISYGCDRKDA